MSFAQLFLNSDPTVSPRVIRLMADGAAQFTITNGRPPTSYDLTTIQSKAEAVAVIENACACKVKNEAMPEGEVDDEEDRAVENSRLFGPCVGLGCERVANARFAMPSDGFIPIATYGRHPHAGAKLTQVIDNQSVDAIIENFNREKASPDFAGVLLDRDHKSQSGDTAALGWIVDLQKRDNGLYGRPVFTDEGARLVGNGTYRYTSPVWLRKDCATMDNDSDTTACRPLKLSEVALTNNNNIPMPPITKIV